MTVETRFALSIGLIVASTIAGYLARRRGLVREGTAGRIMTPIAVAGYPTVGFLAIWQIRLTWSAAWLPLLGGLQTTLMALLALAIGRRLFDDPAERGLVGFSCGIGNHGATMAGFVIYLLFGARGLGLSTVYAIYTFFAFVLLSYTIAQRYAPDAPQCSVLTLMFRNLLHWRAAGLYASIVAIVFSAARVPVPPQVDRWHLLDIAIYVVIALAYFSVGLRLHVPHIMDMGRAIAVTLFVRHVFGLALGFALVGVTLLTTAPLDGTARHVFLIQSCVPMGVMGAMVANMFGCKPREASALFVVSSVTYLLIGIPIVLRIFG